MGILKSCSPTGLGCRSLAILAACGAALSAGVAAAQDASTVLEAPIEQLPIRVATDSGMVEAVAGANDGPQLVYSTEVGLEDAPWLRLQFEEVILSGDKSLGDDAFLWITSLEDGAVQIMTQQDLERWGYTSAYFNGDEVRVELYAYPGAGKNRLKMDTILAGPPADFTPFSLCGSDNRVLSSDAKSARVLPAQCTVFMIDDATHNFLTAGHCATGLQVVQFNVPLSTESGGLVNPPPEDQYPVDPDSLQWQFSGIGNDWAYFGVFPNSNTGLTPFQASGVFHILANAAPPVLNQTIRITGYGTDTSPSSHNSVQQTSTGPYEDRIGDIIRYAVDTTGGNSGSAVVDLTTGLVIGIHTNAGCTSAGTGSNQGNAIQDTNLQNALNNPQGVAAEADCNNNGVPDFVDLAQGMDDCNDNGILDTCEGIIVEGDLNGTNTVDGTDLSIMLASWGAAGGSADINSDGVVDGVDLAILLSNWGSLCDK